MLQQRYRNPRCLVARQITFCTVAPNNFSTITSVSPYIQNMCIRFPVPRTEGQTVDVHSSPQYLGLQR